MKHLQSLIIALVLFTGTQVFAQSKVAHIDVQALMTTMPEMKAAQEQLKKVQETYDNAYNAMVQEYKTKAEKYQQEAATAGDVVNETRSKEMQDMGARIQQYQQDAQKQLSQKELDLLKPIMEKAQQAIQKVAKDKGVNYVLDATNGSGVLFADGIDLLADVKKELKF